MTAAPTIPSASLLSLSVAGSAGKTVAVRGDGFALLLAGTAEGPVVAASSALDAKQAADTAPGPSPAQSPADDEATVMQLPVEAADASTLVTASDRLTVAVTADPAIATAPSPSDRSGKVTLSARKGRQVDAARGSRLPTGRPPALTAPKPAATIAETSPSTDAGTAVPGAPSIASPDTDAITIASLDVPDRRAAPVPIQPDMSPPATASIIVPVSDATVAEPLASPVAAELPASSFAADRPPPAAQSATGPIVRHAHLRAGPTATAAPPPPFYPAAAGNLLVSAPDRDETPVPEKVDDDGKADAPVPSVALPSAMASPTTTPIVANPPAASGTPFISGSTAARPLIAARAIPAFPTTPSSAVAAEPVTAATGTTDSSIAPAMVGSVVEASPIPSPASATVVAPSALMVTSSTLPASTAATRVSAIPPAPSDGGVTGPIQTVQAGSTDNAAIASASLYPSNQVNKGVAEGASASTPPATIPAEATSEETVRMPSSPVPPAASIPSARSPVAAPVRLVGGAALQAIGLSAPLRFSTIIDPPAVAIQPAAVTTPAATPSIPAVASVVDTPAIQRPPAPRSLVAPASPRQPAPVSPVAAAPAAPTAAPTTIAVGTTAPAGQAFAAAIEAADRQDRLAAGRGLTDAAATAATSTAPVAGNAEADADQPSLDMRQQGWPAAMVDHIERLRDVADATSTRIRIVPDALGSIDVSVRRHDDGAVQVSLAADRPQTQALIADARPELTRLADERGTRIEVSVGGGSAGSTASFGGNADHRQPATQPQTAQRRATAPALSPDDTTATADGRVA